MGWLLTCRTVRPPKGTPHNVHEDPPNPADSAPHDAGAAMAEELTARELDTGDPGHPLLICVRVKKPENWDPWRSRPLIATQRIGI